jgi:hypothetical protein
MRASFWSLRDRAAVITGLVLPAAVAAVLVPFRTNIPNTDAALVLVGVVVAIAANGHRLAGILAAASAALSFDFFLTSPYERFAITQRADVETTVLLLLVGAAVTELAVRGRRQRVLAVTDEAYLAALGATADLIASGKSTPEITDLVCAQLTSLLGLRACRFEQFFFGGLPRLEADGRLRWRDSYWDLDQYGMPKRPIELLAQARGAASGRFVLEPVSGTLPALAARRVATMLASQVGAALASPSRVGRS